MKRIVVTASTGNIGSKIVQQLLNEGQQVIAITRDKSKAAPLAALGASIAEGSLDDHEFLTQTLIGADALFALIPPEYTAVDFRGRQNAIGESIAKAIVSSGVPKVVNLSSLGAEHSAHVGPIKGLHDQEQRLNQIKNLDLTHLRAAYFYENTFFGAHLVAEQGVFGTAVRPDVRFAHVATADIANIAVKLLTEPTEPGSRIIEAISEPQTSMSQITRAIAQTTNKPVQYVSFPYDATRQALISSGLSADVADQFVELYDAMNQGLIHSNGFAAKLSQTKPFAEFIADARAAFGV
jgi:uncharacterized protein YbjT (DUF2867 family)